MITIHKFPLLIHDEQEIRIPVFARLLSVQSQGGIPTIWAMVDTEHDYEDRTIVLYGTGTPVPKGELLSFIGTVQIGSLVWHIFEKHEYAEIPTHG